ncbi:Gfo/Idh/MocA family protein [Armatimonas rosea]|uniref:Glycosyl hydrolase family 109 protein n=1 Tax=Armatimonas rosea TaxID=685828 RepID=A0A7W9W902_ARMRO|nr:Gfo/Idh/MocA family oxidoreductase [Armatimonas rosea]MBB6052680.1 putative dehydrogenase [Armatimonas rosea]
MSQELNRRELLLGSAALALGTTEAQAQPPSRPVRIAVIGIGGQGTFSVNELAKLVPAESFVALCDVDDERAGKVYARFPGAKKFYDWREMFDKMGKEIEAVVIATPDHTHFHPAYRALSMGKHVYLEKPMAHSVWEVRELTKLAAEKKVATQLGVQRHTLPALHKAVEIVQSGLIGKVTEVHSWIASSRGMPPVPTDMPPVPSTLKYDLWLGPGPQRPYTPDIVPYKWRFFWDYGTGEAGNWGCHILDIPFWALGLTYPSRVDYHDGDPVHAVTTPTKFHVSFKYEKDITLHWYQGTPAILKEKNLDGKGMNNLFIGEKGMLLCGFDKAQLIGVEGEPSVKLKKSPGFHKEWLEAIAGGTPATCHFGYSGPMTETVLLGNVAYRAQEGFDWDSKTLKASSAKASALVRPKFPKGWTV